MEQKIYQVDAFTNKIFLGKLVAVCPLEQWPSKAAYCNASWLATELNLRGSVSYA